MLPTASRLFEYLPRYLRRHRLMRAWMAITGEPSLQLVRIRDGAFGYADMSDGFLRLIVIEGNFETEFLEIADKVLKSGGTFLDIGANYGLLSFGLAKKHGVAIDFHLFEPNPMLVQSIKKSKMLYPTMRMTLNAVAVSEVSGTVKFAINESQSGASHICRGSAGVDVPCIALDDYITEAGLKRVELLKLDVEGYELSVLRGARRALERRVVEVLYFECFEKFLTRVSSRDDLIAYLQSLDLEVCFCRRCDIEGRASPTHTLRQDLAGHGLPLLPIAGLSLPPMTDLAAVPRELLVTFSG